MDGIPFFPMFISLNGKRGVVIGGGTIAFRRISTLLEFGCDLTVIAPKLCPSLEQLVQNLPERIHWECREYAPGDLEGAFLAVAATDQREVNHQVFLECRKSGVLASIADRKEECDFYFPAVIRQDTMVVGVNGGGTDHKKVRQTADWLREHKKELFACGDTPAET